MKKQPLLFHALFWVGLYLFWILVFQKRTLAFSQTATVQFCYLLFIAANYYFNTVINFPRFLHKKRYFLFSILFISALFLTALLRVPLAMYLNKHFFIPGKSQPGFSAIFFSSLLNISTWVVFILAAKLFIERLQFQQRVDEIKRQKEQAELDFLNAQFNPHFLFNSIHSIYGHIDKQNHVARNMLLTFSDMLRYQLYECNKSQIPVDRELNYIRNYISLQKVRKGEGLKIDLCIGDKVAGFTISPLLFITFIENAFKYCGHGDEPGDHVGISFKRENSLLVFECENSKTIYPVTKDDQPGIGLSNARRRLALLYPEKHELHVSEDENNFRVQLKITLA